MSFLSYKLFTYLNLALFALTLVLPWLVSVSTSSINITLLIISLIVIGFLLTGSDNNLVTSKNIPSRIVVLVVFISAIFLNFSPYVLKFTNQTSLLFLVFIVSGLSLISILFTDFKEVKKIN